MHWQHMMALRGKIPALIAERNGSTAIEFAVIAPVLLSFVLGILEFGMIFTANMTLEHAASSAARFGLTGYTEENATREESILQIIRDQTAALMNPDLLEIESRVYEQFDEIGQEEPYTDQNANGVYDVGEPYTDINGNGQWDDDMARSGAGGAGDIVVYTIHYDWPLVTPIVGPLLSDDGTFPLTASVVVRNEPFETM